MKILPTLADNDYELVLAIDILEHFTKEDGVQFLTQLKRIASKAVLVSTPKEFISQEIEANPYENHRSWWKENELLENGFSQVLNNDISWVIVSHLE
ncbi:hypothetical protein QUF50_07255 [Thiotrichales bacterium HSG1]|nr:hypothetical protein [Thiotrichales bacterium HSG1]